MRPEDFFAGHPEAWAVFTQVRSALSEMRPLEIRASRSQVAFRRRRGFAYLWMPGQYLRRADAEVVLSIALGRHIDSPRFKELVQPAPHHWMHHLEIGNVREVDDEVVGWLREAAARAG